MKTSERQSVGYKPCRPRLRVNYFDSAIKHRWPQFITIFWQVCLKDYYPLHQNIFQKGIRIIQNTFKENITILQGMHSIIMQNKDINLKIKRNLKKNWNNDDCCERNATPGFCPWSRGCQFLNFVLKKIIRYSEQYWSKTQVKFIDRSKAVTQHFLEKSF